VGAWLREVGDGTDADADGLSDGKLQAEISGLEPLGSSPLARMSLRRATCSSS
jgi:hypothetical protein